MGNSICKAPSGASTAACIRAESWVSAVRFTPAGGTITLDAVEEGQEIVFTVTDTGPGFSPEALQKAGRELFTTDAARGQHWGLGLAAARRTAQTHNGTLTVSNGENGGGKVELRVRR